MINFSHKLDKVLLKVEFKGQELMRFLHIEPFEFYSDSNYLRKSNTPFSAYLGKVGNDVIISLTDDEEVNKNYFTINFGESLETRLQFLREFASDVYRRSSKGVIIKEFENVSFKNCYYFYKGEDLLLSYKLFKEYDYLYYQTHNIGKKLENYSTINFNNISLYQSNTDSTSIANERIYFKGLIRHLQNNVSRIKTSYGVDYFVRKTQEVLNKHFCGKQNEQIPLEEILVRKISDNIYEIGV